ncbi:hypothetical protein J1605_008128 [Eschrichtius robustus]|uniref:Uncharacterized protein n=1 Tax=Eschrichtius robustus TaxID=9764 RepID=A0AB34H0E9_ESCRO|nr:hypothetical protein J1605_008128 [Eschrichtius robustus]
MQPRNNESPNRASAFPIPPLLDELQLQQKTEPRGVPAEIHEKLSRELPDSHEPSWEPVPFSFLRAPKGCLLPVGFLRYRGASRNFYA